MRSHSFREHDLRLNAEMYFGKYASFCTCGQAPPFAE
jgi:hypothetical protein